MFDQCWANVVDGGPTLVKHWVYVSSLLGRINSTVQFTTNALLQFVLEGSLAPWSPVFLHHSQPPHPLPLLSNILKDKTGSSAVHVTR